MYAGSIHMTTGHIPKDRSTPTAPGAVIHRTFNMSGNLLDHREDSLVARAQIIFGKGKSTGTKNPWLESDLLFILVLVNDLLHPASDMGQVTLITGREQEQHPEPVQRLPALGIEVESALGLDPVGHVTHDLVGLFALERPRLAVRTELRDLDDDLLCLRILGCLDHKPDLAVGSLSISDDLCKLDARVDILEDLPVNALDLLSFLKLACPEPGRGARRLCR